jgi:hypothetical protein
MTVKELKELIAEVPDDAPVVALMDGFEVRSGEVNGLRYAEEYEDEKPLILYC